jgi:uncharacterized protein YehS (DUF1456 family)
VILKKHKKNKKENRKFKRNYVNISKSVLKGILKNKQGGYKHESNRVRMIRKNKYGRIVLQGIRRKLSWRMNGIDEVINTDTFLVLFNIIKF